jgi:anti-sigma-K factor RskA
MDHHPDLHDFTGAYALNALSPDEEVAFEAHLATCADCRTEVAELEAVAALLADGAVTPPPELRSELLTRIATTPQEPRRPTRHDDARDDHAPASSPAPAPEGDHAPPSDSPTTDSPTTDSPTADSPTADSPTADSPTSDAPTSDAPPPVVPLRVRDSGSDDTDDGGPRGDRRRWQQTVLAPAAAVLAIAVVGLSWWAVDRNATIEELTERLEAVEASSMEVAELVASDDLQTWNVTGPDGSSVRLVYSPQRGEGWLLADDMAPAPEGKTYELWLIDDDGATPAGVFDATPSGVVAHPVTGDVMSMSMVGVTVEPAGGSPEPTSDPVMLIEM